MYVLNTISVINSCVPRSRQFNNKLLLYYMYISDRGRLGLHVHVVVGLGGRNPGPLYTPRFSHSSSFLMPPPAVCRCNGRQPHQGSWVACHNPRKYKALLHFVANGGGPSALEPCLWLLPRAACRSCG